MRNDKLSEPLDSTDKTILRLLQEDGTTSNPKLAEQLSLSVTPCWRRIKRLQDEGYIIDYQANLDRRKLGFNILAFVQITFGVHTDKAANDFEIVMRAQPEVLSCHKISGNADYMLQVITRNLDEYSEFVEGVLRKIKGIHTIHSSLSLREIKFSSRIPVSV
jgi:Lrp/AsnC family leucine-responsive transcriptional regulator